MWPSPSWNQCQSSIYHCRISEMIWKSRLDHVTFNFLQWLILLQCTVQSQPKTKSHFRYHLDHIKRLWYLLPMRAAQVQASLRIRAVSPEPSLLTYTSSESRGTFRQKARSLAPLNGWACAVKICHDRMLEDTNSLDGAHLSEYKML